jgi:RNA polymerase sigma factor (sigma-70 family)
MWGLADDRNNVDWDGLVAREGDAVWRAVRRVVGNDADAEDVFQETFVAAVELSRREPVRQWRGLLLRLAHARAIDRLRFRYRRARRESEAAAGTDDPADGSDALDAFASPDPSPDEHATAAELGARLRAALADLPERQAEVFTLFCLEGWTYQEISEHLAMSIDAVGVNVHRARGRLRVLLEGVKKDVREVPS